MFPKVLHQTWKTKDLEPITEFEACSRTWITYHPAYFYRLWDDKENHEFVKTQFPNYFNTWLSFDKNIKRIDSIRYMWMYKYGGIYADLDMECLRSLDELINSYSKYDSILFCDFGADGQCISANPALMVSKPGSKFWLKILEYAKTHREEYVTRCTGPHALGQIANLSGTEFNVKFLDQNKLFIRKHNKSFYTEIPGNQNDHEIYRDVFCSTEKPEKYYLDKKKKYVADWHGTPKQFRWHNEYSDESTTKQKIVSILSSIVRKLKFDKLT